MPKISVIVPVYKAEQYLSQCVGSILGQTFSDLELLLIDDGSPDNCPQMCDEFAKADPRIRVVHKKNGGVSSARNAGLDAAIGEYVTFVDSDDWVEKNMYEDMMTQAEEFDCDVVMCDCVKEYSGQNILYSHDIRSGFYSREKLEQEYFQHLLMMENVEYPATISNWLLLFRRELAENLRYLTGVRYSEDLLFGAQLMYAAKSFYYMKGLPYYHYVMNPDSATHKFVPDKWNDYLRLHRGIRESFGATKKFDFTHQIDLCLLFFLYNSVGDILGTKQLSRNEKIKKIHDILKGETVREMFARLEISSLPISKKQQLVTWLYKRRLAIGLLCMYYERG